MHFRTYRQMSGARRGTCLQPDSPFVWTTVESRSRCDFARASSAIFRHFTKLFFSLVAMECLTCSLAVLRLRLGSRGRSTRCVLDGVRRLYKPAATSIRDCSAFRIVPFAEYREFGTVNELAYPDRRRGETAVGKRCRGARQALQAGIDPKRRDAEVPKLRPVAQLQTEISVNEWAGEGAEK